jgi:DNA-binding transcriptional MerR regulator
MNTLNQQELASRLNLTDRNIRLLEERGVIVGLANGEYDFAINRERYRLFRDRDVHTVVDRMEDAALNVDDLLTAMEAEPDIETRRTILRERGAVVGQFMGWMKLANAMRPEHERDLLEVVANTIAGQTVGRVLYLCKWQLADPDEGT